MQRLELKKRDILSLNNTQYEIINVIGNGANCIAYKAKKQDGTDFCLKECFPCDAKISRGEDNSLLWEDKNEQSLAFERFKSAYSKMKELYSIDEIRNSTPITIDIYEGNGTIYSLTDLKFGKNFEDDKPIKLSDIITVGITLSKLISNYHNKGYLHLDIKPENIFLLPETREAIVLFDVDSIVPIKELKNGLVKSISFSKDFSAPEQRDFKTEQICEQTDFYAIGSTLFYKIMGSPACSSDRGIFAEWDFSKIRFFENINPDVKKEVTYFFKKTLALNPKKRFSDVESLIESLEKINELSREEKYIDMPDSLPASVSNFVGREKELAKIRTAFSKGKGMIFLQGFGGIGKSELAKKYASIHENEYNEVIFLEYSASLKDTLKQINIHAMEDASFDEKEADLKKLLTSDYLLIIDNFDVDIHADDYLDELAKYTANIIFTTRTDFSEYDCEAAEFIKVQQLKKETLLSLFVSVSGLANVSPEDEDYILRTLKLYQFHTLFVRPLAYKIKKRRYTPHELYDVSKKELLDDKQISPIRKDGKVTQETLNSLAKKLFRLEDLNPLEQQVLSDLYILNDIKVDIRTYADIICADALQVEKENTLISLVEKGAVQEDELNGCFSLHPIIMELVAKLFSPDVVKCSNAAGYINFMVDAFLNKKLNSPEIPVTFIRSSADFPLHITSILSRLDMSISENADYALDLIFKICSNSIYDYLARQFHDIISVFYKEDIRVKYLNFLCEFTSMFDKRLSAHSAHREEEMVECIVSFYKGYDDGSDLFGCIFWRMIRFYYNHLENFNSMGWNISLLDKIQNCIEMQNEFGLSLYDYIFRNTDFCIAIEHNTEKIIDESDLFLVSDNIEKIFLEKQAHIKQFSLSTENKTSAEIYKECVMHILAEYDRALSPYINKTDLTTEEKNITLKIYEQINDNKILSGSMKADILQKYSSVFVNFDRLLAYHPDYPADKMMSELLEDTSFKPEEIIGHLKYCAVQIVGNGRRTTIEEHKRFMRCIKDLPRAIDLCEDNVHEAGILLSKILFSCFMTQPKLFKETMTNLINKRVAQAEKKIISGERVVKISNFGLLLPKTIEVDRANELYSILKGYFDEIESLSEKYKSKAYIFGCEGLLSNCLDCANAAFRETKAEFYQKEYNKLKKYL